jgi:glycosidase
MKLLLDFEPNHTALDHEWVKQHPEYYIHGTETQLKEHPNEYVKLENKNYSYILANGRNPQFEESWPDTIQLNYRHEGCRKDMIQQLLKIAKYCDGVRY